MANILVVMGPPCAGKGTNSKGLANLSYRDRRIFHISVGDTLRGIKSGLIESRYSDIIQNGPPDRGDLPDGLVNKVIFEAVGRLPEDSYVILDGYPSFSEDLDEFKSSVDVEGHNLLGGIFIDISRETCYERMPERGARSGERVMVITNEYAKERFNWFERDTIPILRKLEAETPFVRVDGEKPKEMVFQDFKEGFSLLAEQRVSRNQPIMLTSASMA